MKKPFALLLALVMSLSLVACGGGDDIDDADLDDGEEYVEEEGTGLTDANGNEVTQETINTLSAAYNAIAIPYNEIVTAANENGWMEDEQTAAEIDAVSTTLGFVGTALTEDLTMLEGTDFDALIESLETEFPEVLDILSERVAEPYVEAEK